VLGLEQVGIDDNFFDLGGHSLALVEVQAKLVAALGREIPVVTLFEHSTVGTLADHLVPQAEHESSASAERGRLDRQRGSHRGGSSIAIIAMSGRFPGARDVESFWSNLRNGVESIRFFTEDEMRECGVDEALLKNPQYVGARGALEEADLFDATFFGYSAREAEIIDPQQRVFLECAWEALERAGYDPDQYQGLIGVYAGSSMNTYYLQSLRSQDGVLSSVGGLTTILASGQDFLPTRVSYKLNLRGPSVNVQTACSTSLVAVHEACRSLIDGECDLALAGGVSVIVPLKSGYLYIEESIGSPDGHCRAFDAGAQGTVGGNGVAIVALKRLEDALADGDTIHAVIRGTAINNDGSAKVGYTAPSVEGQAKVIAMAQAAAAIDPDSIGYVEAHGTGTLLGDPVEVTALSRIFAGSRQRGPCWLGSVKTNVGHLDAAAGITGLIKAALCLKHKELVPSLHYKEPNPEIDFEVGPFRVNTELRRWETDHGVPRRAGVSSFGLGGTNAHAVLEEAPDTEPPGPAHPSQLVCLSARTPLALEATTSRLADHLKKNPNTNLADAAYTLQVGRGDLPYRRVIVCSNLHDAVDGLEKRAPESTWSGQARPGARSVVFMFTGQGAQYTNMGRDLYQSHAAFREHVDKCCELLEPRLGADLRRVLFPDTDGAPNARQALDQTQLTQPALFVIEYALAHLWMHWGIRPVAMIGHSIGEYVAACLAGVMSLKDALGLVAERARLMGELPAGSMLAVPLPQVELDSRLGRHLSIASVNGPNMCVISGANDALDALSARLAEEGVETRLLHTSHAFHSPMMEPILETFTERVRVISLRAPEIPYISNVTGAWITIDQATNPSYYAQHLRHTVQFSKGLEQLFAHPDWVLLEVGPGHTLSSLAKRHPGRPKEQTVVSSLRHPEHSRTDDAFVLAALGQLWLAGVHPDWTAVHSPHRCRRIVLPTYPFERQRYWIEPRKALQAKDRLRRQPHPRDWIYVPCWRRAPLSLEIVQPDTSRWCLFTDQYGLGSRIAAELRKNGSDVVCVGIGDRFGRENDDSYTLNPAEREHYDQLVAELANRGQVPDKFAHLWLITSDDEIQTDAASLTTTQERGFYSLIYLAQALDARGLRAPLVLTVVTNHVFEVTGDEVLCPGKATVLGPSKVIGMEYPHITCRHIDISLNERNDGSESMERMLAVELCAPWSEPVAAYRGRYRWLPTYERLKVHSEMQPALRQAGVYLITGGLGDLGLAMAGYLARTLRAKLTLTSRTALPSEDSWARWLAEHDDGDPTARKIRAVQALQSEGAEVLLLQADVADETEMSAAWVEAERRFGPICGVMHAAGAEKHPVSIQALGRSDCEKQFRPKLQGLIVLDKLLRDRKLDFCLVHSSLASIMGVTNFAAYTATHTFMDAFVCHRNRTGQTPWLTVNWDNWNLQKLGAESLAPGIAKFLMTPEEGVEALRYVLSMRGVAQVLVSTGDPQARLDEWEKLEHGREQEAVAEANRTTLHERPALSTEYVAPRNDVERALADIWREMLGIERVGIHDNFFELGGDSVVSIQVTAKANQAGLRLTPKQVFDRQTIAELASVAGTASDVSAEQSEVVGPLPLTPIQHWFFAQESPNPHHFNQAMLLETRRSLDLDVLKHTIETLLSHHDALRLRFMRKDGEWLQRIGEAGEEVSVRRFDIAGLASDEQRHSIEMHASELQRTLNLIEGPLLQVAYFDLGPKRPGRLLIIIHHLAIDAVSWRILLEDLQRAYEQLSSGGAANLPAKTTSLKQWSERLTEYARTPAGESELGFWGSLAAKELPRIPIDTIDGANTAGSTATVANALTPEETQALLTDVPKTYNAQINDLLFAALWQAFFKWTGHTSLALTAEGHGREAIIDGVDMSRTLGWFTTLYPVRIEANEGVGPEDLIKSISECLREIPHHGMGYGILRYLHPKQHVKEAIESLTRPDVLFLYLGQFDPVFSANSLFAPAQESPGPACDPACERQYLLEITAAIRDGELRMSWNYSQNRHRPETIQKLARDSLESLRLLISHCQEVQRGDYTPSDFSASRLSQRDLDRIAQEFGS
jgi:non-ribosomal peptide synthase protein (TIGR01720 family)